MERISLSFRNTKTTILSLTWRGFEYQSGTAAPFYCKWRLHDENKRFGWKGFPYHSAIQKRLSFLSPGEVLNIKVVQQHLFIASGGYTMKIKGLDGKDFPIIPQYKNDYPFSLPERF